ncbi:hypothetical protein ES319_D12G206000v1 [Gossypium barbadense]|uniref:AIPP2-like SPOC-like domain-containing protein n=1 Tax=Gossypium barbadense TaxID=3634 RepID=A0A5J5P115_GOSBA|nr:hypothetical protein ES319_D12G206000v1 [Gossypium barbadense]
MGQSRDTHLGVAMFLQDKICDICGDVGFEELIRSCSQCTMGRHLYCMRVVVRDDLEDWICEGCLSKNDINSLNSGQAENVMDSSTKVYFDLWGQVPRKRQKAVETGKVKFLPTEEVIKLSSLLPLPKRAFPSNSNSGLKPVPANFTLSPSKRVFMGSKYAGPCYNPIKVRRNPTFLQLGSDNVPRGRGGQISASIRHQHSVERPNKSKEDEEKASRTPAKQYGSNEEPVSSVMAANEVTGDVDSKATNTMKETLSIANAVERAHLVPNKENVCQGKISDTILPNKELTVLHTKTEDAMRSSRPSPSRHHTTIMSSGQNIHGAAEPENSDVPKTETWSRLKVSLYRPHAPSLHPTWMGGFKFFNTTGDLYGDFLALPPCRVHRKAYEFSKKMPAVLQVNLLQQWHLHSHILQNGCLDLLDIALYFCPVDMERSQRNYNKLFQLMGKENSVMISYIDDLELLIFTSEQLHADSWGVFTGSNKEFFGGVFRRVKEHQKLPSLVSHTQDAGEADDMVSGKMVGISNMALSK